MLTLPRLTLCALLVCSQAAPFASAGRSFAVCPLREDALTNVSRTVCPVTTTHWNTAVETSPYSPSLGAESTDMRSPEFTLRIVLTEMFAMATWRLVPTAADPEPSVPTKNALAIVVFVHVSTTSNSYSAVGSICCPPRSFDRGVPDWCVDLAVCMFCIALLVLLCHPEDQAITKRGRASYRVQPPLDILFLLHLCLFHPAAAAPPMNLPIDTNYSTADRAHINTTGACASQCCQTNCKTVFPAKCASCCSKYITLPADCNSCLKDAGCATIPTPAPPPPTPAPPGPAPAGKCVPAERDLACDLYHSTSTGDGWTATCKSGWEWCTKKLGTPIPCCEWSGISCNSAGHMTILKLGGCNLQVSGLRALCTTPPPPLPQI